MTDGPCTRPCGACRRSVVEGEPDPCLGLIPGVSHACCGHGDVRLAYVVIGGEPDQPGAAWLPDSQTLEGEAALAYFEAHAPKGGPPPGGPVVANDPFSYRRVTVSINGRALDASDFDIRLKRAGFEVSDISNVAALGGCPQCGVLPLAGDLADL